MRIFRIRAVWVGSQGLHQSLGAMYLANHRSWAGKGGVSLCLGCCQQLGSLLLPLTLTLGAADFFIDQYLVEARAATLSRLMVAAVFPVRLSAQPSDRGTWHINNNHHSATLLQVVMLSSIAQRSVILFQRGGRRVQQREVRQCACRE